MGASVKSPNLFILSIGDCREMHSDEPLADLDGSNAGDLSFPFRPPLIPFHADIYLCVMISQVHEISACDS